IFRRKKENELIVTISNINSYPISITALSIKNKTGVVELELLTTFPVQIEQKQVVKLKASFNAIAVNDNMLELKVFCTFTQRHEKAKIETLLTVETKGAMTNEFDDEFEI
ncbi:MAG: hypothetical protein HQK74_08230, partial [Desulfamplus sp.]|nr:hypothetical protein [Desulfamplus sp.]